MIDPRFEDPSTRPSDAPSIAPHRRVEGDPAEDAGRVAIALEASIARHVERSASRRERLAEELATAERTRRQSLSEASLVREQAIAAAKALRTETLEREEHRYRERLQRIDRELVAARQAAIERA